MKVARHWPWALLLIPVALGLIRVRFDVEVLNLLPRDFPVVTGLKLYQKSFSNARELIITVDSPDPAETEQVARTIASQLRTRPDLVTTATWQPPFLEAPGQSAELIAFLWLNRAAGVEPLLERLLPQNLTNTLREAQEELATSMSPDRLARRAYDPFYLMDLPADGTAGSTLAADQRIFSSEDGTFRVVFVEAASELVSYRECAGWLTAVKAIVDQTRPSSSASEVRIAYTGRPAFVSEIAGGMERDIVASIGSTLLIISTLFYIVHRRWKPLLWLVLLLGAILACTTALGGLLFGALNVVSLGFAAILLGLAVDYGLVLYQEAQAGPAGTLHEIRKTIGPGILWSATTTAAAFMMLNGSGLPGLGQLGSLVSIGLVLAAFFMLYAFLPPLLKTSTPPRRQSTSVFPKIPLRGLIWCCTALLFGLSILVLRTGGPSFDPTADALRPADSDAYAAVEQMKKEMSHSQEPLWLLIKGSTEAEVEERLKATETVLSLAQSNTLLSGFTLSLPLWPSPASQNRNKPYLEEILQQRELLESAACANGFTTNALLLTRGIFTVWERALATPHVFWPTNPASRWVMGKIAASSPGEFVTLGLAYPASPETAPEKGMTTALQSWLDRLQGENVIVSGWQLMGTSVFEVVRHDLPRILVPMMALTLIALGLAFRSLTEVLLSVATLATSALALWSIMTMAGWSWNLINMMALPLLLGAGVDYSIHMQLGLRRHQGDVTAVMRTVGKALLLCAATTFTAFASLSFSSNAGLASLGKVCAAGVLCSFVTAVGLLPGWWSTIRRRS